MIQIEKRFDLINDNLFSERIRQIDTIIIHGISNPEEPDEQFGIDAVIRLLLKSRVSTHYLIGRRTEKDEIGKIIELIPPEKKAWHAGKSLFKGLGDLNQNAIGIELIGDWYTPYVAYQLDSLISLIAELMTRFPLIRVENIKPHQIVSDSSVRDDPKPDPGRYFDWLRFGYDLINELRRRGIYR